MPSPERFARLTERHKQCLRLVFRLYETKDIATELNLTEGRVNKIIAEAMLILGANRRAAAARMLARHEAEALTAGGYSFTGQTMSLPQHGNLRSKDPVVEPSGTPTAGAYELREVQMPYGAPASLSLSIPLPFPTNGRPRNDLSTVSTTFMVMAMTLLGAGMASTIVSFVMSVNRLFVDMRGGH